MKPQEKELKYSLTPKEHRVLRRFLVSPRKDSQENYFFDSADLDLRKSGFALRLRIVNGQRATLTLKGAGKERKTGIRGYAVRTEHEAPVTIATARRILKDPATIYGLRCAPARLLKREERVRLVRLGKISTVRLCSPWRGLQLELDKTRIPGSVFHELEIETDRPKAVVRTLRALFKELGIRYRPGTKSKFQRFLNALKK